MQTGTDGLQALATAVAKAAPDFDEEQQKIALQVYRRLAEGSPASASEIAERASVAVERVDELLGSWPGVFRSEDGGVIGFWGLTIDQLSPTHALKVDGRKLFAWCAWDTLFLPGILDATARVESQCPTTAQTISLVVSPRAVVSSSHPAGVLSFLLPEQGFDADVIQSFCHFVHFFVSPEAGEAWTADHPGTFLLTLEQGFELGRLVNALNFPSAVGDGR